MSRATIPAMMTGVMDVAGTPDADVPFDGAAGAVVDPEGEEYPPVEYAGGWMVPQTETKVCPAPATTSMMSLVRSDILSPFTLSLFLQKLFSSNVGS